MSKIKKIIVELNDQEATFKEFETLEQLLSSEIYLSETGTVVTEVEAEAVSAPVEPAAEPVETTETASETPVTVTE